MHTRTPCPRCRGLCVPVTQDQSDEGDWTGSRCMNCGHRFDVVMVAHRAHRPEPSYALKSARHAAPWRRHPKDVA
jgi:hypothetical protein